MKTISYIILISTLPFFFSCKKENTTIKENDDTGTSTNTVDYNVQKNTLLQLVNNVRKSGCKCGSTDMPAVPAVTWNDLLAKAAFEHSKEMEANKNFSHTGINGSNPGDRITKAGYSWTSYGENIANGYPSEEAVITGWLNSEGHCKNIMSASVKEMGAGRQANYWTQEFASK